MPSRPSQSTQAASRSPEVSLQKYPNIHFSVLDELVTALKQEGEVFGDEQLQECFGYLVGKMLYKEALPKDFITAEEFA